MLSFKLKYLTEANLEIMYDKEFKDKITPEEFKKLTEGDPTPNKNYVRWITKTYLKLSDAIKKRLIEEDLYKVKEALQVFDRKKQKLDVAKRDINKTEKFDDLYDLVEPLKDVVTKSEKKEKVEQGEAEGKKIYEDDTVKIIVPFTKEAACYYGKGTRWCTASQTTNYFDHYTKKHYPNSKLYIFITKKEPSKKYQVHFESGQVKDEDDREINRTTFVETIGTKAHAFMKKERNFKGGGKLKIDEKNGIIQKTSTNVFSPAEIEIELKDLASEDQSDIDFLKELIKKNETVMELYKKIVAKQLGAKIIKDSFVIRKKDWLDGALLNFVESRDGVSRKFIEEAMSGEWIYDVYESPDLHDIIKNYSINDKNLKEIEEYLKKEKINWKKDYESIEEYLKSDDVDNTVSSEIEKCFRFAMEQSGQDETYNGIMKQLRDGSAVSFDEKNETYTIIFPIMNVNDIANYLYAGDLFFKGDDINFNVETEHETYSVEEPRYGWQPDVDNKLFNESLDNNLEL